MWGLEPLFAAPRPLRRKDRAMGPQLEPAAVAVAPAIASRLLAAAELAARLAVAALLAVVTRRQHPLQHGESALLAVVKTLVERVDGISDLLQSGSPFGQRGGPLMQTVAGIARLRLSVA